MPNEFDDLLMGLGSADLDDFDDLGDVPENDDIVDHQVKIHSGSDDDDVKWNTVKRESESLP